MLRSTYLYPYIDRTPQAHVLNQVRFGICGHDLDFLRQDKGRKLRADHALGFSSCYYKVNSSFIIMGVFT